jgi:hypothetical protein
MVNFANFAETEMISTQGGAGDNILTVLKGAADNFLDPPFKVTVWNKTDYPQAKDDPEHEIELVDYIDTSDPDHDLFHVAKRGGDITGADNTGTFAHDTLDKVYGVELAITAGTMNDLVGHWTSVPFDAGNYVGSDVGTVWAVTAGVTKYARNGNVVTTHFQVDTSTLIVTPGSEYEIYITIPNPGWIVTNPSGNHVYMRPQESSGWLWEYTSDVSYAFMSGSDVKISLGFNAANVAWPNAAGNFHVFGTLVFEVSD